MANVFLRTPSSVQPYMTPPVRAAAAPATGGASVAVSGESYVGSASAARFAYLQQQLRSLEVEIQGMMVRLNALAAPAPAPSSSLPSFLQPAPAFSVSPLPIFSHIKDFLSRWLSPAPAPAPAPSPAPAPPSSPRRATEFVISSFNVLGSSHTVPGRSERPGMDAGPVRIRRAAQLLAKHDVDIVGFQELQGNQLKEFLRVAGDTYAVYPGFKLGKKEAVNSIAWRKDEWDLVKPGHIEIPYFNGNLRKMPVVRLRNKQTGQEAYFANFHNPASTRKMGNQKRWRDEAARREVELANRLMRESGLPVFIVGDMNERDEYYRRMTNGAPMVSADEGPGGKPPKKMAIDWIFGSEGVKFTDYVRDRSPLVKRTTDHPMIVSKARIG